MAPRNPDRGVFRTNPLNGDNAIPEERLPPLVQHSKYHHGKRLGKRELTEKLYSGKVRYAYDMPGRPEWRTSSLSPARHANCKCFIPLLRGSKRVMRGHDAAVGDGFDLLSVNDLVDELHRELDEEVDEEVADEEQKDKAEKRDKDSR
jgi:hypothetical protein